MSNPTPQTKLSFKINPKPKKSGSFIPPPPKVDAVIAVPVSVSSAQSQKISTSTDKFSEKTHNADKSSSLEMIDFEKITTQKTKEIQEEEALEAKKNLVIPCTKDTFLFSGSNSSILKGRKGFRKRLFSETTQEPDAEKPITMNKEKKENVDFATIASLESDDSPPKKSSNNENSINYDDFPVEGFGLALLKGMNFDPKNPRIGRKGETVALLEPPKVMIRPKNAGIGSDLYYVDLLSSPEMMELEKKRRRMMDSDRDKQTGTENAKKEEQKISNSKK